MSEIFSAMSSIPEDKWNKINWKDSLVDSSNGKTLVSKTEVEGSTPSQSAETSLDK